MPRNQLTKDQIKADVLKIKQDLYVEHIRHDMDMKGLANRYLDRVLDKIEEYRY
jgi:hypothetical protein